MYKCLIDIRNKSKVTNLTDVHQLLGVLKKRGVLQRCYTQNIDGLEARAGLSTDLEPLSCELVQLHGNLESLRCSYCKFITDWNDAREIALVSGESLPCPNCSSRLEERQKEGRRAHIHVGYLRTNVVLYHETDDPWAEKKAIIIDSDSKSSPDVLLIIGTSLAVDGAKRELKHSLIPAIRHNGGKVIYINNKPPPKMFCKPMMDHIFEMDCDSWVRDLATHQPSIWIQKSMQAPELPLVNFGFQPKVRTVSEVIGEAGLKLISIGDYSSIQFRPRNESDMREDLSSFLPQKWLSTSPLMCVLSLFGWNDSTKILHSKFIQFNAQTRKNMLKGSVWPIERKHKRVIIPYNPSNHWILIEVGIPDRVIRYYDSLSGHDLSACCEFVEAQMKRVGERLNLDYSMWNPPVDGVSVMKGDNS